MRGPHHPLDLPTSSLLTFCMLPRAPHLAPFYFLQIMLWSVPASRRPPLCISTPHRANIFGVQFLPQTGDSKLVTASMDHTVQLHELERAEVESWVAGRSCGPAGASGSGGTGGGGPVAASSRSSRTFYCHTNRVKVRVYFVGFWVCCRITASLHPADKSAPLLLLRCQGSHPAGCQD